MLKNREKCIKILFVLFITILSIIWVVIQPSGVGPDESMKMDICKYIADTGRLPHGGDKAIRNPIWGISYGFTPILSYMFGAGFIKIASFFTQDLHIYYIAGRLVSVVCYVIMAIFIMKIGEKLFKNKYYKWFFIVLITLLPQMVFLSSYINNDSLALMSISIIIYAWIIGLESKWNIKSCVTLGTGLGICALSYYNAYGYILTSIILFIVSYIINKEEKFNFKDFLKKGIIISIVTLLICGWWFVRSAIIYNGDFLGLSTSNEYAEKYALDKYKPSKIANPKNTNIGLKKMLFEKGWIKLTFISFIANFGAMNIIMGTKFYVFYFIIFLLGIIGYILRCYKSKNCKKLKNDKNRSLLEIIFGINIVIPILLSIYYSYSNDYQPQGRYIMPMLIPFMYFIVLGLEKILDKFIKNEKLRKGIEILFIIIILILPVYCLKRLFREYC